VGYPDIVYSVQRQSSGIRIWLNRGGRQWTPGKGPTEIHQYEGLKVADLNGDGHIGLPQTPISGHADTFVFNLPASDQPGIVEYTQAAFTSAPSNPAANGHFIDDNHGADQTHWDEFAGRDAPVVAQIQSPSALHPSDFHVV